MFHKLLFLLFLCLSAACHEAVGQTNKQIRKLQKEQTNLKKDIADKEQLLRSTKKDVNSQLANLQVIGAQIEERKRYVDDINAEVTALGKDQAALERQMARLEAELAECKRKYQRAVTYMFKNRMAASKWQFILSARNFRQMYRRLRYVQEFSKFQRAQGRIIQQKEAALLEKRRELMGVKQEKNKLLSEGRAQQKQLEGQHRERQQVVNELNKKQQQLQASIAQQRKKAAQLDARIDKLIQEEIAAAERRRAEAERKRKAEAERQARLKAQRQKEAEARKRQQASAKKGGGKSASAGKGKASSGKGKAHRNEEPASAPKFTAADNADRALSNSFAGNKGRLPMPITGSYAITTHYGQYNVEGLRGVQLDSKGINITGHPGAQARAVYKGEVTAIFTYGGMYNVIVRHGSYMSVYCNLSSTSVHRGQQVEARQSLGTVATDASGNCTLHFQLRKETAKLNPEAWLGR